VAHKRDTLKPLKKSTTITKEHAESCGSLQNEAGTCRKKWHKTDTTGSTNVPNENAAPAVTGDGVKDITKAFKDYNITLKHFEQLAQEAEPPFSNIETAVIEFASQLESDPDLEPSLGWTDPLQIPNITPCGLLNIDLEGDDSDCEPSLGWTNESQCHGMDGSESQTDCELDDSDKEPEVGQ